MGAVKSSNSTGCEMTGGSFWRFFRPLIGRSSPKRPYWIGDDWAVQNHPFLFFEHQRLVFTITGKGNPQFFWFSLSHSLSHYSPSVSAIHLPTNGIPTASLKSRWFSTPSCRTSAPIRLGGKIRCFFHSKDLDWLMSYDYRGVIYLYILLGLLDFFEP